MRRQTILVLATIAFFSSCNRTPDLTEEEIYVILNEIITDDSLQFASTLCSTFEKPLLDNRAKKSLTDDDLKFTTRQLNMFSDMVIKANKVKRTGWRILEKKNISPYVNVITIRSDTILHSYFSFPIISADRKKVILKIGYGGGFMVGGQQTYLFEKKGNKWVQADTWDIIIV